MPIVNWMQPIASQQFWLESTLAGSTFAHATLCDDAMQAAGVCAMRLQQMPMVNPPTITTATMACMVEW
jgi:hypothetical protein